MVQSPSFLQLVKKFPHFTEPESSLPHSQASATCLYPRPAQSSPTSHLLEVHLRLGLPTGLLPSGFPTNTLYTPLSSPISTTCPAHLILLDFITRTILGEEYKSFNSSLCYLLHSPVTSSFLGPKILLNTMFGPILFVYLIHVSYIIYECSTTLMMLIIMIMIYNRLKHVGGINL